MSVDAVTGPVAQALQSVSLGYPPGVTVMDLVPEQLKHMVHPHWNNFPPVNPMWHYVLGMIYCFLFVFAFSGNGLVLYLYAKEPALHTPSTMLVVNLALSDWLMIITNFPFFIVNCWNGGWAWSAEYCTLYAFFGATTGTCSIIQLMFISYDRYNVIVNGVGGRPLSKGTALGMCLFSWAYAIGWAIPPLFGWGKYMPEGILTTCSYDYLSRDFNTRTYAIAIFVFEYAFPMFVVVFSYVFIVKAIFSHEAAMREQAKKMKIDNLRSNANTAAESAELRIAKVAMTNVAIWTICWTPYTLITIQGLFGDASVITALRSMLPALFAKSCSTYNPMVYAINHPKFRAAMTKHVPGFCIHEPEVPSASDNKSTDTAAVEEKPAA